MFSTFFLVFMMGAGEDGKIIVGVRGCSYYIYTYVDALGLTDKWIWPT